MIIIFKLIIILSIWVLGIKIITAEGMLLEGLGKWGERKVDEGYKIFEALIVCQWCLPSFHSIFAYAFAFGLDIVPFVFDWKLVIMWPLVVMGASIITGNTWNIYETINRIKERNEAEAEYFNSLIETKE